MSNPLKEAILSVFPNVKVMDRSELSQEEQDKMVLDPEGKLMSVMMLKEGGNHFFKSGDYKEAAQSYHG